MMVSARRTVANVVIHCRGISSYDTHLEELYFGSVVQLTNTPAFKAMMEGQKTATVRLQGGRLRDEEVSDGKKAASNRQ